MRAAGRNAGNQCDESNLNIFCRGNNSPRPGWRLGRTQSFPPRLKNHPSKRILAKRRFNYAADLDLFRDAYGISRRTEKRNTYRWLIAAIILGPLGFVLILWMSKIEE